MPAFSRATSARVGPAYSVWSRPDVGDHRDLAVAHVRGVPATQQPDLDDGDVDRGVGERAEGRRGEDLEVRGAHAGQHLEVGRGQDLLGERVVVDGLGVEGDALVHPLEVRAGVGADAQALGHQQPRDHLRRRALAVRAGHVDDRRGPLGIAHDVHQPLHAVEAGRVDAPAEHALEVRVLVEVGQGGGVVHGGPSLRGVPRAPAARA